MNPAINTSISLLSKRESSIIKGMLILLIILGHNGILMGKAPGLTVTSFNNYLYSFHVYCFLFLPFLYNIPLFTKERIKKNFIHLYKPYTAAFLLLLLISLFSSPKTNLVGIIWAYISGSEPLLKTNIGASFIWFLPTMFSLLLMRDFFMKKGKKLTGITLLSFIILSLYSVFNIIPYNATNYFILGMFTAIRYLGMAILLRFLTEKYINNRLFIYIIIAFAIISSTLFFCLYNTNNFLIIKKVNANILLPILMFLSIINIVKLLSNIQILNIFEKLGSISLEIYIIHVFIYNAFLIISIKLGYELNFWLGITTLALTIIATISIISITKKTRLYKFIFK